MARRFERDVVEHTRLLVVLMTENDYWPNSQVAFDCGEANRVRSSMRRRRHRSGPRLDDATTDPRSRQQSKDHPKIPFAPTYLAMQRRPARAWAKLIDVYAAFAALRVIDQDLFASLYIDPWRLTPLVTNSLHAIHGVFAANVNLLLRRGSHVKLLH